MKEMTFVQACKDFFGMQPNQKPIDFMKEVRALNEKDRSEITTGLEQNGYKIILAPGATA